MRCAVAGAVRASGYGPRKRTMNGAMVTIFISFSSSSPSWRTQVDAPQAVRDVPEECQPRRPAGSGVAWPVVLREDAPHDIFVDVDAKVMRDLLRDADAAEPWIASLQRNDSRDEFGGGAHGPGFTARLGGGKQQAILMIDQRLVEFEQRCRLGSGATAGVG